MLSEINYSIESKNNIKVAIYLRVSTHYQIDGDSLKMQRSDLTAYCKFILNTENYVIFEDAGFSGKDTARPAFQKMLSRIRTGEFTHILVWKIDRISRNLLDFASLYQELKELNVTFVSKNEQFDTSTAIGEAMLKIILVFAELERNMTSERVTATMLSRASKGLWNGGVAPFGYKYNSEHQEITIDETEYSVCRLMIETYLETKSLTLTAKKLNTDGYTSRSGSPWSPATIHSIITGPFYVGTYRYNHHKGTKKKRNPRENWVIVENHHPAIFSKKEQQEAISILKKNRQERNSFGKQCARINTHVFSGIVRCGLCRSKMTASTTKARANGYKPSQYSCPQKRFSKCSNTSTNDSVVGEFVINYILNMLNAKKTFSKIRTPQELEKILLAGSTFKKIRNIEANGVNDFFNLLSRYKSDSSYVLTVKTYNHKAVDIDPVLDKLRKEKDRQERALNRLQDLYLYSDNAISEKDFLVHKSEICSKLDEINIQLGMTNTAEDSLSDEEFIRQASHFLIQEELKNRKYIYYRSLASNVSPEVLKTYMNTILDSVYVSNNKITEIIFKNGLSHKFLY